MPTVARHTLFRRLRSSGMLEEVQKNFRLACRMRVDFAESHPGAGSLAVPLEVGSVLVGWFRVKGSKGSEIRDAAIRRLLEAVSEQISFRLAHDGMEAEAPALPGAVARGAIILQDRFREPITLPVVAGEVGLSPERFSRLFHASLGLTFTEYRNQLRLEECRRGLIQSDLSITRIAGEAGFQSLSQFNRRFRAAEGMSPREFRAKHSQEKHINKS